MAEQFPALHAYTHLPEGSDPLPFTTDWTDDPGSVTLFCDGSSPVDPTNYSGVDTLTRPPPGGGFLPYFAWLLVQANAGYTPGTGDYYLTVSGWGGTVLTFNRTVPVGQGWTQQASSGLTYPAFLVPADTPGDYHEPGIYYIDPADSKLKLMNDHAPFTWASGDTIFAGNLAVI